MPLCPLPKAFHVYSTGRHHHLLLVVHGSHDHIAPMDIYPDTTPYRLHFSSLSVCPLERMRLFGPSLFMHRFELHTVRVISAEPFERAARNILPSWARLAPSCENPCWPFAPHPEHPLGSRAEPSLPRMVPERPF